MSFDRESVEQKFLRRFGAQPEYIASAPGRVNLIGEHTDYNGGFVLPLAINREVVLAAKRRTDSILRLLSIDLAEEIEVDLAERPLRRQKSTWANYVLAIAAQLLSRGVKLGGLDVSIEGDIPIGAGLSSSAAMEVATAHLFCATGSCPLGEEEIAELCQDAEQSDFIGVQCGIMDQMIACVGYKNQALLLDCYSLRWQMVPFEIAGMSLVAINTKIARELARSHYNLRRRECEYALSLLREQLCRHIESLRHCTTEEFEKVAATMPEVLQRRVRHVISENHRVLDAAKMLEQGDIVRFGKLLYESHASLRDDYEVSCPELDFLVAASKNIAGVMGARMTGAGFGGCTIHLVKSDRAAAMIGELSRGYSDKFGFEPEAYTLESADGAHVLHLPRSG